MRKRLSSVGFKAIDKKDYRVFEDNTQSHISSEMGILGLPL